MIDCREALAAWGSDAFAQRLQALLVRHAEALPLQQGLQGSSVALSDELSAVILGSREAGGQIVVTAGLFYHGIIAGSCCADDPTPVERQTEYCEVRLEIDRQSGLATVSLL